MADTDGGLIPDWAQIVQGRLDGEALTDLRRLVLVLVQKGWLTADEAAAVFGADGDDDDD